MTHTAADRTALIALPLVVLIGALVALAGSQGGASVVGVPVFAMAVAAAFAIQWVVFVPSFAAQTERFFDLTGSLTYISITLAIVLLTPGTDARALLLAALVLAWAARLGTFLFRRVHRAGKDDRFDELKPSLVRFLNVWTIQGLWVTLTAAAAWVSITSATRVGLDWFAECLTDWDPAANAMGWQWVAGSGPDAAPYFRVFNPAGQAEKFDPAAAYQRRYIAEMSRDPGPEALAYFKAVPRSWGLDPGAGYPAPILDLGEGRARALAAYGARNA